MGNVKGILGGLLVLFLGIALIAAGFYLFVGIGEDERIFWLNLSAVVLMYSVNVLHWFDFLGTRSKFEQEIGAFAIRLWFIPAYSIFVLVGVFVSMHYQLEFLHQLFLQSALVFFLVSMNVVAALTTGKVVSVANEQRVQRQNQVDISKILHEFELWCMNNPASSQVAELVTFLKEEVRYMAPSNDSRAKELELEISSLIENAFNNSRRESFEDAVAELCKCQNILQARKQIYSS